MGTRSIVSFTPTKDMTVTFDPMKLPAENPFSSFEGKDNEGLEIVKKKTRPVSFKKGNSYSIYCHWDGYPEGVGAALLNNFTDENAIANLIAAGDCSSIVGHVVPYTSRGEVFNPPNDSPLGSWCARQGAEFVHRWTSKNGWEVAEVPDFYDENGEEMDGVEFDFQSTSDVLEEADG